jgi:hypothetical protein
MALSIKGLYVTLSINNIEHKYALRYAECHYALSHILFIVMLSAVMLSVIMLYHMFYFL